MKAMTMVLALSAAMMAVAQTGSVDFSQETGRLRPELHSSGLGPRLTGRDKTKGADIKALNLYAARTHDWALVSPGQRACDTHFIFPLMKLDPKDPTNYYFKPTDELLRRTREMGLKVYYRLGTSIEHTGDVFYNAAVPDDYEKYAEVLAGIIRHYTRGWADGFNWDIAYWEIWNEPDGIDNMWRVAGPDGLSRPKMQTKFAKFFAVVLKRLKSEFPELKIGGPAMCEFNVGYFNEIFAECRKAGVAPDFISWHYYGSDPRTLVAMPARGRELCDKAGFAKTELIINEWHYLPYGDAWADFAGNPAQRARVNEGPAGINGIDSAVFTLSVLAGFQETVLGQSFFYGCGRDGAWGYLLKSGLPNLQYSVLKLFGETLRDCDRKVKTVSQAANLTMLAAKARDGRSEQLILADYRGIADRLSIEVKGLEPGRKPIRVEILDEKTNLRQAPYDWREGVLTVYKNDANSAACKVVFATTR